MNYKNIYNLIIKRAQDRIILEEFEKHHIIPKSLGGSNKKENIVKLTYREHYLCHYLLYKIHQNKEMIYAFWRMANKSGRRDYRVTSHTYERLKSEFIKEIKLIDRPPAWNKGLTKNLIVD